MIPALLVLLALVVFVGFMAAASWSVGRGVRAETGELATAVYCGAAFGLIALGFFIPVGLIVFAGKLLKAGAP